MRPRQYSLAHCTKNNFILKAVPEASEERSKEKRKRKKKTRKKKKKQAIEFKFMVNILLPDDKIFASVFFLSASPSIRYLHTYLCPCHMSHAHDYDSSQASLPNPSRYDTIRYEYKKRDTFLLRYIHCHCIPLLSAAQLGHDAPISMARIDKSLDKSFPKSCPSPSFPPQQNATPNCSLDLGVDVDATSPLRRLPIFIHGSSSSPSHMPWPIGHEKHVICSPFFPWFLLSTMHRINHPPCLI